jgi:hypothetical protein
LGFISSLSTYVFSVFYSLGVHSVFCPWRIAERDSCMARLVSIVLMYQRGYDILEHPLMGSSSMEYNNVFCESFHQTASQMTCSVPLWEICFEYISSAQFHSFWRQLDCSSSWHRPRSQVQSVLILIYFPSTRSRETSRLLRNSHPDGIDEHMRSLLSETPLKEN